jgi:hypothetical protein
MQAMPDASVATLQRASLPADLGRLLETADLTDVDALFARLEQALRAPATERVAAAVNVVRPAAPATAVRVVKAPLPAPAPRRRVLDVVSFVGLRALLPIGIVLAGVLGLLALVG